MKSTNPNEKQQGKVYKPRITTYIILGYAVLNMIFGIILLIIGIIEIVNAQKEIIHGIAAIYLIIIGIPIILVSSLIYIIGALSKDVYDMVFFLDYIKAQNENYYHYSAEHMQQLERDMESIKSGIAVISSKLGEKTGNSRRSE